MKDAIEKSKTIEDDELKCPYCNSLNVKRYLYGMPSYDYDKEKYILGGCEVSENNPKYKCIDCGKDIYVKSDLEKLDKIMRDANMGDENASKILNELKNGVDIKTALDKYNESVTENHDGNISLEQAKIIAEKELHCHDERIILSIRETDNIWIISAGVPGVVRIGGRNVVAINKTNGEVAPFILPRKENFELLKKSKLIYDYEKNSKEQS